MYWWEGSCGSTITKDELEKKIEPIETDIKEFKEEIVELNSKLKDVGNVKELDFDTLEGSYGYLTEMPISSFTEEKVKELMKKNDITLINTMLAKIVEHDTYIEANKDDVAII